MKAIKVVLFALALVSSIYSAVVNAEESIDDRTLILLVGPAMEKNTVDGSKAYGTSLAVEFTAIEHQLEIEVETQYLSTSNPKELGAQIIFKKPFELASDIELGVGLGPAIWRKTSSPSSGLQSGVSFVADFMFWTTKKVGWYLSPSYTYGMSGGAERVIGLSVGLLFSM
ncbi:hypothetical protein [Polynucleobacter sp. MWH-Svant-W18]|uniref:hypothetical protein n=1 Tax=Polynucleobacter sp. MWH-Svant-W18 TaxID=1855909 RepID=UPI001BFEA300|nr:hypothetical protein [Polynucleobacter sp. MWH-Svant-W18]QWD77967.1 hypothetical protein C2757_08840 [Polynucleobacter sp. MWH-Svant-W18]